MFNLNTLSLNKFWVEFPHNSHFSQKKQLINIILKKSSKYNIIDCFSFMDLSSHLFFTTNYTWNLIICRRNL